MIKEAQLTIHRHGGQCIALPFPDQLLGGIVEDELRTQRIRLDNRLIQGDEFECVLLIAL